MWSPSHIGHTSRSLGQNDLEPPLQHSRSLRRYFSRLWCCYEVAAYLKEGCECWLGSGVRFLDSKELGVEIDLLQQPDLETQTPGLYITKVFRLAPFFRSALLVQSCTNKFVRPHSSNMNHLDGLFGILAMYLIDQTACPVYLFALTTLPGLFSSRWFS